MKYPMEEKGLNVVFKSLTVLLVLLLLFAGINLASASVIGYSVFDIPTGLISLPGFGGSAPSSVPLPGGTPKFSPPVSQGDYFLWMKFEDGLKNTISGTIAGSAYEGKQVTRIPRPDDPNNKALSIQFPTSGAVKLLDNNKIGHLEKFTIEVDVYLQSSKGKITGQNKHYPILSEHKAGVEGRYFLAISPTEVLFHPNVDADDVVYKLEQGTFENKWTNVKVVVDRTATEKVKLYVNGNKVVSGRKYEQPTVSSTNYEMLLGARAQQGADTQYFGGLIDNLKLSRTALAAAEDDKEVEEPDAEVTVTTNTKAETPTGTVDINTGSNFFANFGDLKTSLPTKTEATLEESVDVVLPTGVKTLPAGTKIPLNVGTLVPPPTEAGSKIPISSEVLLKALTEARTPSGEMVRLPANFNLRLPAGTRIPIQALKVPVQLQVPINVNTPKGMIALPAGTKLNLPLNNFKTVPGLRVPPGILRGGGAKAGKKTHSLNDIAGLQDFMKTKTLYTIEGKRCIDICNNVGNSLTCTKAYDADGKEYPCDGKLGTRTCICSPATSITPTTSTKLPIAPVKLPSGLNLGQ